MLTIIPGLIDCRQTADTFQAAATFLELVNIWNPPDAETQAKIKYAKWNAVRIVKALKEGKDPNESNPKTEPAPEESLPELDPNDPEVQGLGAAPTPLQASVEEVPDEQDNVEQKLARQSSIDQSLHPSAQVSARGSPAPEKFDPYPRDGFPYTAIQDDNVSPLETTPPTGRNGSIGGGYFPEIPTFTSAPIELPNPTAPPSDALDLGLPEQPTFAPGSHISQDFESFPPPALEDLPSAAPQDYYKLPPPAPPVHHVAPPPPQPQWQPAPVVAAPIPPSAPQPAPQPIQPQRQLKNSELNTDDVAIAKAQKHARWAISALNFEDAETAVRELRDALKTLGAS